MVYSRMLSLVKIIVRDKMEWSGRNGKWNTAGKGIMGERTGEEVDFKAWNKKISG